MNEHYKAVVIGAGQAGMPLARTLAQAGWRTALVEREHLGGTCINEGCTPTKTMVASAQAAYMARRGADYGVRTGAVTVDMARVRDRKRAIVGSFRGSNERRIANTQGLDLLMGEASFVGPKQVEVRLNSGETRLVTATTIFVNTGERPGSPALPGLDSVTALNSTSIMELDRVPEHLLILGGGYIGVEFGQMFRRFGSDVTIVQRSGQLLSREDPDVAEAMAQILLEDGVEVLLNASALRVEQAVDGQIALEVSGAAGVRTLSGSHLLVAAGRTPNTDRLRLDAAGVQRDSRGFIKVNDRLETNVPGIYAWATSMADRPLPTSLTMTSGSFARTCWRVAMRPLPVAWSLMRSSRTRNWVE